MEPAIFNGDTVSLDPRRTSLVFNTTHGESAYPERFSVTTEVSLAHSERIAEVTEVAGSLFRVVVPDWDGPVSKDKLSVSQPVFRRLAGMLDLTVWLMIAGVKFVWKYPEDGLHPKYQANLADVAIALTDPAMLKKILKG